MRIGLALSLVACLRGQDATPPEPADLQQEDTEKNPQAACLEPPPLIRWSDYTGPFHKVVGTIGRKIEHKAAHAPHFVEGAVLCSLAPKDKFRIFLHDTFEPASFFSAGFNAGLDQWANNDPSFGRGGLGYGRRYAANFASDTSERFLTDFLLPTVLGEDPRYYRLGHGNTAKRLGHAATHIFVAHRDTGYHMFNFSELLGTTGGAAISNSLHPGNARGFGSMAQQAGFSMMQDMGMDILREFWPEVAHFFRVPFRDFHRTPSH